MYPFRFFNKYRSQHLNIEYKLKDTIIPFSAFGLFYLIIKYNCFNNNNKKDNYISNKPKIHPK